MNNSSKGRATVGDNVFSFVGDGTCQKAQRGKLVAKGTMGRGSSPTGSAAIRGSHKMSETSGPKCCIGMTLYKANAATASDTTRNVRLMSSAAGVTDFVKARNMTGQII